MLSSNFFFWDWLGAPLAPPPIVETPAARGPWGARGIDYRPLDDEYWADREGRMTQDQKTGREIFDDKPAMISSAPTNQSGIAGINESKSLVATMRDANSVDSLKQIAARIRSIRK